MLLVGWVDEQIEGWKVMLERNVSNEFDWPINPTLRSVNLDSRRKTESSRNMSFLEINRARSNFHERREDPERVIRRERVQIVAVEEGGVEVVEVVEVVDLVEEAVDGAAVVVGTPVTGQLRTRTKLPGAITIGSEVTTRRWRGEGRLLHSIMVGVGRAGLLESYKDSDAIIVDELNRCNEARSGDISRKTYP